MCQDFNVEKGKKNDDVFAATPPLLVSRWLCSCAASQGRQGLGPLRLMTLDFSKAFLYGDMERDAYVELPDEDPRKHQGDFVGKLVKSMYGLRDAPLIWQKVVRTMLEARGFNPLVGTQCSYIHRGSGIHVVAHVDDFLVLGTETQLFDFRDLQREYECSCQVLGYGEKCVRELKFLGRTITLTAYGLEWEGDRRHVGAFLRKLTEEFGTAETGTGWRGVCTT